MSSTNTEINKPYDEEVWLEEATSEDIEAASIIEREYEDAYDTSFTNLMVEKFPHLTNPNYISSPDSDIKKSDVFAFRPPTPPKNNSGTSLDSLSDTNSSNNIGDGTFEYISNKCDKDMLVNAWQAITQTNTWDFVKQDIKSFMWSKDPRINIISEKMEELGYSGHSGRSFGCTMKNMQYLVKNGENKFKQMIYGTNDSEEVEELDSDIEGNPYENEDAMEYEERLKKLIKRRIDSGYYEKRDKEAQDKLLDYTGGH